MLLEHPSPSRRVEVYVLCGVKYYTLVPDCTRLAFSLSFCEYSKVNTERYTYTDEL